MGGRRLPGAQHTVDGTSYYWDEYLLFNPYKGFRYLTQYDGHWNDVQIVKAAPDESSSGGRPVVRMYGETFKHFQSATATTEFVLGEFPWQVRVGDRVETRDFVAPPRMLSEERTPEETTWSLGTYMTGAQVWAAFALPGKAPHARGVFANQPDEFKPRAGSLAKHYLRFAAIIIVLCLLRLLTASRETVFATNSSFFRPGAIADSLAFVTPTFQVKGRTANLEVTTEAQVDNGWAYFDYALVNEATGQTYEFGREVSYYHGPIRTATGPRDHAAIAPCCRACRRDSTSCACSPKRRCRPISSSIASWCGATSRFSFHTCSASSCSRCRPCSSGCAPGEWRARAGRRATTPPPTTTMTTTDR